MWDLTRHAVSFFQRHLPFAEMSHADGLVETGYCLAKPGAIYAVYLPGGGTTRLTLSGTGPHRVRWYDPRNGGPLRDGSVRYVYGPGTVSLGRPPTEVTRDWVVRVERLER